jgi:hypothetical protein
MPVAGDRYWELVKEQLAEERARKSSIEQRGLAVITTSGTLVTILFGLTAITTGVEGYQLPDPARVMITVAAGLFVAAAFLAISTNWAFDYVEVEPEGLLGVIDEDWSADEAPAAKVVAKAWVDIVEDARKKNTWKGQLLRAAMITEAGALVAVALAALVILDLF